MNPESSVSAASKGWVRNQVSYFSPAELSKKKSADILRSAIGHWMDYFLFTLIFGAAFYAVFFILSGAEIIIGEIIRAESFVTMVGDALDNGLKLLFFNSIISIINFVIAILVSFYVFYYFTVYLIAEDGQTKGMRFARVELFRKDGKELSSLGGIGGVGVGSSLILALFYLIFLPAFGIVAYFQVKLAFFWSFIEGFRMLDKVFAGTDLLLSILMTLGYWVLAVVIILAGILIFGLIFHLIWLLAGVIANVVGKNEPEERIAL